MGALDFGMDLNDAVEFYTDDNEIGTVEEIDIDLLKPFPDHPFRLYCGDRLNDMVESIKAYGIMTPVIVRKMKEDYEILAGHNRTNAAKLAGLKKVPCIVKDGLTDEEAYIYVIETNLMQRSFNDMSISEKAVVLKTRYDNIKSQGKRTDIIRELKRLNGENADEEEAESVDNRKSIANEYGLSGPTMARLLRINKLIQDFKDMADEGLLPLLAAVNISYMDKDAQICAYEVSQEEEKKITAPLSQQLRTANSCDKQVVQAIFGGKKEKVTTKKNSIHPDTYTSYFANKKPKEVEEIVNDAVEVYMPIRNRFKNKSIEEIQSIIDRFVNEYTGE